MMPNTVQFHRVLPGEMRLKKVSVGTEINIVQEGLADAIPPDACGEGRREKGELSNC